MANISYTQKVGKRMDRIRAKLEEEDYNEGDEITWSDVLEHILRKADMWALPKDTIKKSKKAVSKEKFQTEE